MDKKYSRIIVDFDETIADSIEAICRIYEQRYGLYVPPHRVKKWDFSDALPNITADEIEEMFDSDNFFSLVKPKSMAFEVLKELSSDYKVELATSASETNFAKKVIWMDKNFQFVKELHCIPLGMSKSIVDMSDAIFFDDKAQNLFESNAEEKVLFENQKGAEWNKDWQGEKIRNWINAYRYFSP